jgi:hypothetical protein
MDKFSMEFFFLDSGLKIGSSINSCGKTRFMMVCSSLCSHMSTEAREMKMARLSFPVEYCSDRISFLFAPFSTVSISKHSLLLSSTPLTPHAYTQKYHFQPHTPKPHS